SRAATTRSVPDAVVIGKNPSGMRSGNRPPIPPARHRTQRVPGTRPPTLGERGRRWEPFHQEVDAVFGDGAEAEAGVEAESGVELFDVDGEGFGGGGGFGLEIAEERGRVTAVAVRGEEGDVHDADVGGATVDVKATDGIVVE